MLKYFQFCTNTEIMPVHLQHSQCVLTVMANAFTCDNSGFCYFLFLTLV